jgi:hypothetical protein
MLKKLPLTELMSVAGLAFLAAAAWTVAMPVGLAATGAALLLLEWRFDQ